LPESAARNLVEQKKFKVICLSALLRRSLLLSVRSVRLRREVVVSRILEKEK
jgi:hypothetical protein